MALPPKSPQPDYWQRYDYRVEFHYGDSCYVYSPKNMTKPELDDFVERRGGNADQVRVTKIRKIANLSLNRSLPPEAQ